MSTPALITPPPRGGVNLLALANPATFARLANWLTWPLFLLAIALLAYGSFLALFVSPADYQQGESVRIMYIHVPAAYMASVVYGSMVVASLLGFVWKHPLANVYANAAAPMGALFTLLAILTGAIWGRPTWGTYWVWDARLTSVLILLFIYLGYLALGSMIENRAKAATFQAVFCVIGAINLPIIRFSVEWWNSLHQPASLIRRDGPSMPAEMLTPLLIMMAAYTLLFAALVLWEMRARLLDRRRDGLLRSLAARH